MSCAFRIDAQDGQGAVVFSDLVVLYLFLGGAGAGAVAVCCVADLALARQPFGFSANYAPGPSAGAGLRTVDLGFLAGFLMLAFAVVCLMADLGRLDRAASLFLSPHPTGLTVGAFSLAALLVLAAALTLVRFLYLPDVPRAAVRVAEAVAVAVALVVMAYTGALLQGLAGVAFWRTPFLPALFVLSSLSCGAAAVCATAPFAGVGDAMQRRLLGVLARFDVAVVLLEAAVAFALLRWAAGSANPSVQGSLEALGSGEMALCWWGGFALCGLLVPLLVEAVVVLRARRRGEGAADGMRRALAVTAAFVLLGALCMRYAIVQAGQHRELALGALPSAAQQLVLPESQSSASLQGAFAEKAGEEA